MMTSRALFAGITLVTLTVIVGFLVYSHATRENTEAPAHRPPALTDSNFTWPWPKYKAPVAPAAAEPKPQTQTAAPPSAESVGKWVADTASDIASIRTNAIASLATAPVEQAVPALGRILTSGDNADRQLALKSLSQLAQGRGDADGRIRGALRQAIYHTDDDDIADSARAALDEIELAPPSATAQPAR
jgi:hypothetical protein